MRDRVGAYRWRHHHLSLLLSEHIGILRDLERQNFAFVDLLAANGAQQVLASSGVELFIVNEAGFVDLVADVARQIDDLVLRLELARADRTQAHRAFKRESIYNFLPQLGAQTVLDRTLLL